MKLSASLKPTRNALLAFICAMLGSYFVIIAGNVIGSIYYMQQFGDETAAAQALASNSWLQKSLYALMELTVLLVVYLFVTRVEKQPFTLSQFDMQWKRNSRQQLLGGMLLALATVTVSYITFIQLGVTQLLSTGFSIFPLGEIIGLVLLMILFNTLPGVIEEILFRGYIMKRLMQQRGLLFAWIVSSVLFAIMHIGRYTAVPTILYVTAMGMLLGYMYIRTQSLYLSIGFHFAWDFISSITGEGKSPSVLVFSPVSEDHTIISYTNLVLVLVVLLAIHFIGKRSKTASTTITH